MERYTQSRIAKEFGISVITVNKVLNGNKGNQVAPYTARQVLDFCKKVDYQVDRHAERERISSLELHNFKDNETRKAHMLHLRQNGYTNVEIAKLTGYTYITVLKIIGKQPKELTLASYQRAAEIRCINAWHRNEYMNAIAENDEKIKKYNAEVLKCQAEIKRLEAVRKELPANATILPMNILETATKGA